MARREFTVETNLNAEEYVAFKRIAESAGISVSGYLRMLVKTSIGPESAVRPIFPIDGNAMRFPPIFRGAAGTKKQEAA